LKGPVFREFTILNIDIVLSLDAVISVESVLNVYSFRINIVQNNISVPLVTSCKANHLKVLIYHFKAFFSVRSNIEASLEYFAGHEGDIQVYIRRSVGIFLSNTMC